MDAVSASPAPVDDRRRIGRPSHVRVPVEAMRRAEGRALTPRELAGLSDMSADKIRSLLKAGILTGVPVRSASSRRYQWRIPYAEAQRWLRELQVL